MVFMTVSRAHFEAAQNAKSDFRIECIRNWANAEGRGREFSLRGCFETWELGFPCAMNRAPGGLPAAYSWLPYILSVGATCGA